MANRILIIDPDTAEIQRMSDHLKQYKVEVFVSTSAQRGVELFFDEMPDLLFVNILMPDLPGLDLVKKIRSRIEGAKTPIYLLSQLSSPGASLLKQTGAKGIIAKPVDLIEFDRAVHSQFPELEPAPSLARATTAPRQPVSEIWQDTTLARLPFPKLLAQIYKNRSTGILTLLEPDGKTQIKFSKGNPLAFSPSALAKFLVKRRYLKTDQAKDLLQLTKQEGINGRDALLRMRVVDAGKINQIFRELALDFTEEMTEQTRAKVRFTEKEYDGSPVISTLEMVWCGVQKQYNLLRLDKIFNKENRIKRKIFLTVEPDVLGRVPEPIRALIEEAIRGKTIHDMLQKSDSPGRKELLQTAYALLICGIFTFNFDEAVEADLRPTTPPPQKPAPRSEPDRPDDFDAVLDDLPEKKPAPPPVQNGAAPKDIPSSLDVISAELPDEEEALAPEKPGEVMISSKELFNAATRLMESGAYSKAQAYLEELVERGVNRPEVLVNLGLAVYNNRFSSNPRERLLDVAWYIKQALSIEENYIPAFLTFAKILEKEQKPDLAEDQYRMVLAVEPQNPKAQAAMKRLSR